MIISPWAMLITRITPKVMASPRPARMRIELRLKLLDRAALTSVMFIHGSADTPADTHRTRTTARARGGRPGLGREWVGWPDLLRRDLDQLALGDATLGPVAMPAGERDLRVRFR